MLNCDTNLNNIGKTTEVEKIYYALSIAELDYPGLIQSEMFIPIVNVLIAGAHKHGVGNWLTPDGSKSSHVSMCNSAFHHLSETYSGKLVDEESGQPPEALGSCRLMMHYVRRVKGLKHREDK